jgi:hypothetical protein
MLPLRDPWSTPTQVLLHRRREFVPQPHPHSVEIRPKQPRAFLMVTFWVSEEAIRAFAGDEIGMAKYFEFDKDFLLELEPCSTHYEMYDN